MRLLADENVPLPSVRALRAAGHDVAAVGEHLAGADDGAVLAHAHAEGRLLVTFDRDFGELIFRRGEPGQPGIIFLRFRPADPAEAGGVLLALLNQPEVRLEGRFTVLDRDRVRQRRLPGSEPAG